LHRSTKSRPLTHAFRKIKIGDSLKGVVLTLRELRRAELPVGANLLARGMCDNPIIIRVFRISGTERRVLTLERLFVPVLCGLYHRGLVCGAFCDGSLVGVCGMVPPGNCRPKLVEVLSMLPSLLAGNRVDTILRIKRSAGEWAHRDLAEPHWHLGPVAVEPRLQGQGIGTALLTACCSRLNEHSIVSYLETDKYKNVHFYRKFAFDVIAEAEVLGVPTWFMSRPAIGSTHSVVRKCAGSSDHERGSAPRFQARSVHRTRTSLSSQDPSLL
jgi:GNAT superfamily N-acetyltransferase